MLWPLERRWMWVPGGTLPGKIVTRKPKLEGLKEGGGRIHSGKLGLVALHTPI